MDFWGSIFQTALGGLPAAAKALVPDHLRRRAAAQFGDLNPFKTISANHDLVRALRIAWVEAACDVLDAARPQEAADGEVARFEALARRELMTLRDAAFDRREHPGESAIDAHLDHVLQGVPEFVAPGIDRHSARPITGSFARTLAALTRWDAREVPSVFGQIAEAGLPIHGGGPPRAFGDLVFAAFAELIKDPRKYPQAREAFHIAMDKLARDLAEATLAAVRGLDAKLDDALAHLDALAVLRDGVARYLEMVPEIARGVAQIEATQQAHGTLLAELLELARESGRIQRAAAQGIPEAAVRAIVERLGGEGIAPDDLIPWLDNWIVAARRELGRRGNEDEAFEAARREADRRFRAGRISDASSAFMEEFDREALVEVERQEERRRRRLRLLEEAIRFDELALNGDAAAVKLRLMAEVEGISGSNPLGEFLTDKAVEFYERGDQRGDNAALLVAVAAYRAALEELTRERVPLQWATTQNNLGNALRALGGRESGTARLEEAVTAFRAALEERTRERAPLQWAMTQNNLGTALATLGERDSGTARLEQAVTAFRAALEERTRERVPLQWAMTQNNLGVALKTLGERESATARLEEAVTAYHAALEERTRERVPLDWAMTQNNLGNALARLGERESGTARLEQAVTAYRAALEEWTRERVPLDWAMTQNNLGAALQTLGGREGGTARLEQAVTAFRAALQEYTRERAPLQWATTQNNLGIALRMFGARESGTARLEEAVAAYRAALEERTRERVPLDWAGTQNNLGNALRGLGERESGTARLEEAVTAYRAALEEYTSERAPFQWALTQENMAIVFRTLATRTGGAMRLAYLADALAAVDGALAVYRDGGAAYYVEKAERLRSLILAERKP
jgi:tetratricopeptide (TPR) repeat protein